MKRAQLLPIGIALAVATLVGLAALARARALMTDPYPVGVDGHYYAVQLQSLLAGQGLNYAASPLAFWLFAPLGQLLGPIDGIKLGAALGTALAAWPAYHLGVRAGGSRAMGLLAAAFVATSASSIFLSLEFIKQGLGLTLALGQLAALAAWLERPARWRLALAVLLAVAALLVHKSSFALIVIVGGGALAVSGKLSRRTLLVLGGVLLAVLAASALFPERLPGVRDLPLLARSFSAEPSFELVALVRARGAPLTFGHEALVAALLALVAAPLWWKARQHPLVPGMIVFALLQGIPWLDVADPQGLAFRLRVSAFVALPVLAPFVLGRLLREPWKRQAPLALAALLLVARPATSDEGSVHAAPPLVQAARAVQGALPPGAEIVTQDRQLAFMIRFYAGTRTRLHAGDVPAGAPVYRLFSRRYFMRPSFISALETLWQEAPPGVVLPRGLSPGLEGGIVVMPEATWEVVRERLSPEDRAYYDAWPTS